MDTWHLHNMNILHLLITSINIWHLLNTASIQRRTSHMRLQVVSLIFVTTFKSIRRPCVCKWCLWFAWRSSNQFQSFQSFQSLKFEAVWTSATSGIIRSGAFLMVLTYFFLLVFIFRIPFLDGPRLSRELDCVWSALRSFVGSTNKFYDTGGEIGERALYFFQITPFIHSNRLIWLQDVRTAGKR